jgi:hypothetical protein
MKKGLIFAVLSTATLVATPTLAQSRFDDRASHIEYRIERGVQTGDLTEYQADRLRSQLRYIERIGDRYEMDGLRDWERRDLDRRYDDLARQIRYERNDSDTSYHFGFGWY